MRFRRALGAGPARVGPGTGQAGGFLLTSRIPGTRLRAQRPLRSESPDAGRGADAEREGISDVRI